MTQERIEPGRSPSLGSVEQLDLGRAGGPRRRASPPPRPSGGSRRWLLPAVVVLGVGAIVAALGYWREPLGARLVPESAINQQVEQAQQALARGELSSIDGLGAREQFQAVLARDPDHLAARAGLNAVRDAALAQAAAAIAKRDPATARSRLELARSMAAPAAELTRLEMALQRFESAGADVADKLERARAAQARGDIDQLPDGALALYSQVLEQQPDNALAIDGLRDIFSGLLRQAEAALATGNVDAAQALVDRVVEYDPSHLELPALQARLGEAQRQRQQSRDQAGAAATAHLQSGRLEAAAAAFEAMLAQDPRSGPARQGLADTAAAAAARAGRQAADFDFDAADASLQLAESWSPDSPAIAAAKRRLLAARAARGQLPALADAPPGQLEHLVDQARAAMRRGDLVDSPGESAWDRLRQAAAIAPDAPQLRQALVEYDRRARACFEDELAGNRLGRAQACLDARALRERGDSLQPDRRRLADRWLAFADERMGANELALARRALQSAQALDPGHPGIAPMAERLARAGG